MAHATQALTAAPNIMPHTQPLSHSPKPKNKGPKQMKKPTILITALFLVSSAAADWIYEKNYDDFEDKYTYITASALHSPKHAMDPPYNNVDSRIAIVCIQGEFFAYFYFTTAPNLLNSTHNDYGLEHMPDIKWGTDKKNGIKLRQSLGSKSLDVSHSKGFVHKLKKHEKVSLKLDWYGGTPLFTYDLKGATEKIDQMTTDCQK